MSTQESPLLSLPVGLVVDIFSYLNIQDYQSLAHLRLLSKYFNQHCFPFLLSRISNVLKCGDGKKSKFVSDLCSNHHLVDEDWYKYNFSVPEGISIVDGAVPRRLRDTLMNQIKNLAYSPDYSRYLSKHKARELVNPALYPLIQGISKVEPLKSVPPCIFVQSSKENSNNNDNQPEVDFWGRKYNKSTKCQWLPTYFEIDDKGNCTISNYINDLAPRSKFSELYSSLEELFVQALPQLESAYNHGRKVRSKLRTDRDASLQFGSMRKHYSLKGQKLQVFTKIVDYEIGAGKPYEGEWHVNGIPNEEIVATAMYFLHCDENIDGGNILFKRAFYKKEASAIEDWFYGQEDCKERQENIIEEGFLPLGQVEALANRLLVFPNTHVHKMRKMRFKKKKLAGITSEKTQRVASDKTSETKQSDSKSHLEIQRKWTVTFLLVNPEKRIISTREVKPQQMEAGGNISREEAFAHHRDFMKERKLAKKDWNVRDIYLRPASKRRKWTGRVYYHRYY
jgi:hypothetical protein